MIRTAVCVALVCLLGLMSGAQAKVHQITWVTGRKQPMINATVGDTLHFQFTYTHDVNEVPSGVAWPDSCTAPRGKDYGALGPIDVPLKKAGMVSYVCSFGTHCKDGMQSVTVNVAAASGKAGKKKGGKKKAGRHLLSV